MYLKEDLNLFTNVHVPLLLGFCNLKITPEVQAAPFLIYEDHIIPAAICCFGFFFTITFSLLVKVQKIVGIENHLESEDI